MREADGFAGGLNASEIAKHVQASSSNGRAAVSKTACWGFESLLACQLVTGGAKSGAEAEER